jgi:hypothetical protein
VLSLGEFNVVPSGNVKKGKVAPVCAMKAYREGGRGIAPLMFNLDTRWR